MDQWIITLITAVASVLASSGFWALISKRIGHKDAESRMLIGLAHDRIISIGMMYIQRGWVTHDELENLIDYLYKPYEELGGNGSAKQVVERVKKLEIR